MTNRPFRLLCADPPWKFRDSLPGKGRGAKKHYKTQKLDYLFKYPVPKMAADSLLLLWRVAAMTEEAILLSRAWGFEPKAEIVWIKTRPHRHGQPLRLHLGMGRYTRGSHEVAMVCARGKASSLIRDHGIRSVFFAPVGRHSEKPSEFYNLAEDLFPGPRVELFARAPRSGWTCYGDQLPGGVAHP